MDWRSLLVSIIRAPLIAGLSLVVFCYHQFGLQPKFIGWPLTLAALVVFWRAGLWVQGLESFSAINLALMALLSFYFQTKDEEATPPLSDNQTLQIREVFVLNGGRFSERLWLWIRFSTSVYAFWGTLSLLFSPLGAVRMAESPFYYLASVAVILISIRFSGGSRGRVWEKIGKVLRIITLKPTLNQ